MFFFFIWWKTFSLFYCWSFTWHLSWRNRQHSHRERLPKHPWLNERCQHISSWWAVVEQCGVYFSIKPCPSVPALTIQHCLYTEDHNPIWLILKDADTTRTHTAAESSHHLLSVVVTPLRSRHRNYLTYHERQPPTPPPGILLMWEISACRFLVKSTSEISPSHILTYAWKSAMTIKWREKYIYFHTLVTYLLCIVHNSWQAHQLFISPHQDTSSEKHGYINNKQVW